MEIKEVAEQNTVMIRLITSASRLSDVMGEAYGELGAYMGRKGIQFAGPPYAMYYNMDMEALDVEMGFPTVAKESGEGRIKTGQIPGGKVASALHAGPYAKLEETYRKLMDYVNEKGVQVYEEWMYEFYLNSPMEVPPEELQTEIRFILM